MTSYVRCIAALLMCITLAFVASTLLAYSSYVYKGGEKIVVLNPFGASYSVEVVCAKGSTTIRGSKSIYVYLTKCSEIRYVVVSYRYARGNLSATYVIEPARSRVVYAVIFPPYLGAPRIRIVKSYSWYDYPWIGAPWGLEIMVGTDSSYVEESMAGRIFVLFYGYPERMVEGILGRMGIEDCVARYEISSTALWAAQLVREVRERWPDPYLCIVSTSAILAKYYGFPKWLSTLGALAMLPMCWYVKFVDEDELYKAILYAIKSVKRYIEVFPQWERVDEAHWVEMCKALRPYTVEPLVPTYAHALVAGAYILYELHKVEIYLEKSVWG